jgi:hypothetical protein
VNDFVGFLGTLEQQLDRAAGLIEGGGDFSTAPKLVAPAPESEDGEPGESFALDRAFARQLHDMLGKYLASGA